MPSESDSHLFFPKEIHIISLKLNIRNIYQIYATAKPEFKRIHTFKALYFPISDCRNFLLILRQINKKIAFFENQVERQREVFQLLGHSPNCNNRQAKARK